MVVWREPAEGSGLLPLLGRLWALLPRWSLGTTHPHGGVQAMEASDRQAWAGASQERPPPQPTAEATRRPCREKVPSSVNKIGRSAWPAGCREEGRPVRSPIPLILSDTCGLARPPRGYLLTSLEAPLPLSTPPSLSFSLFPRTHPPPPSCEGTFWTCPWGGGTLWHSEWLWTKGRAHPNPDSVLLSPGQEEAHRPSPTSTDPAKLRGVVSFTLCSPDR